LVPWEDPTWLLRIGSLGQNPAWLLRIASLGQGNRKKRTICSGRINLNYKIFTTKRWVISPFEIMLLITVEMRIIIRQRRDNNE
jgi:hypothetical protein